MITFKKFILESNTDDIIYGHMDFKLYDEDNVLRTDIVDDIVSTIKNDCSPWLNELQGAEAYRGMLGAKNSLFVKKETRPDRRPRDTSKHLHDLWDDWFEKKFGFRARSQSIFISGNKVEAHEYGEVYLVFPIGKNYNYLASRGIRDLTNQFARMYIDAAENDEEYAARKKKVSGGVVDRISYEDIITKEEVFQTMNEKTSYIQGKNLSEYLSKSSTTEVMVQCDSYYALYVGDPPLVKPILELL